jgi:hypothetical protein
MNRKIIASLLNNANHLDTLGFIEEANTLTKLAQAYSRREVGPPTIIQVGPRGSFDQSSVLNEIAPTDRKGYEVIVVLHYPANETEKRLDGFKNIEHANNTAKKIARNTKEQYGVEPRVTLWSADPAYIKAHEMFMKGDLDRLDLATVKSLRNEMMEAAGIRPSNSRPAPSAPPRPRQSGVYTLTYNYDPDRGYYLMMNEDGRVREIKPSGGRFKDLGHVVNYSKSIKRDRPEFKIIDGYTEDLKKKWRDEDRRKSEFTGDVDPRDRNM